MLLKMSTAKWKLICSGLYILKMQISDASVCRLSISIYEKISIVSLYQQMIWHGSGKNVDSRAFLKWSLIPWIKNRFSLCCQQFCPCSYELVTHMTSNLVTVGAIVDRKWFFCWSSFHGSSWSGSHFTKDFATVIQIGWVFHSALIKVPLELLITMKFCTTHDSCAVVAYENFLAIWLSHTKTNFPSNLNYDGKIIHEMGPWFDKSPNKRPTCCQLSCGRSPWSRDS